MSGGENGIRTHERISSLHAFQACAFNHSATSPDMINFYHIKFSGLKLDFFPIIEENNPFTLNSYLT